MLKTISDYDEKLKYIENQKIQAENQLGEIRFSGLSNIGKNRKRLDDMEEKMTELAKAMKLAKDIYERITNTANRVLQGVIHLAGRLDDVGLDFKDIDPEQVNEDNLPQVLAECLQKIEKMMTSFPIETVDLDLCIETMLKERENLASKNDVSDGRRTSVDKRSATKSPLDYKRGAGFSGKDKQEVSDWNEAVGDDNSNGGNFEQELTRKQIKDTEIQMVNLETRCRRKLERRVRDEKIYELDAKSNEYDAKKFAAVLQDEIIKELQRIKNGQDKQDGTNLEHNQPAVAQYQPAVAEVKKQELKKKKDDRRKTGAAAAGVRTKQRGRPSINT
jgi:hypothetical protein